MPLWWTVSLTVFYLHDAQLSRIQHNLHAKYNHCLCTAILIRSVIIESSKQWSLLIQFEMDASLAKEQRLVDPNISIWYIINEKLRTMKLENMVHLWRHMTDFFPRIMSFLLLGDIMIIYQNEIHNLLVATCKADSSETSKSTCSNNHNNRNDVFGITQLVVLLLLHPVLNNYSNVLLNWVKANIVFLFFFFFWKKIWNSCCFYTLDFGKYLYEKGEGK